MRLPRHPSCHDIRAGEHVLARIAQPLRLSLQKCCAPEVLRPSRKADVARSQRAMFSEILRIGVNLALLEQALFFLLPFLFFLFFLSE